MVSRALRHICVLVAAAAAVSGCSQGSGVAEPQAEISQASGDFVVTNSKDGQAIFRASGMAPGGSVSGTVSLTNTGRLGGELAVEQVELRDRPGTNGGLLSEAVQLAIRDVTKPDDAITVFAGQLGVLDDRRLGSIAAGESRTYTFTARLPDNGVPPSATGGDNAFNGSALTVRYAWKATAPEEAVTPPATTAPLAPGSSGRVTFRVVKKRLLKKGRIDVVARCDRACTLTAWARVPKTKRARNATRTKRKTLRVLTPRKRVRIKLEVTKRTRRALVAQVRRKGEATVRVALRVRFDAGVSKTYVKRVTVKRRGRARR